MGNRGFTHAHIYTCPPRKGQNYIFPFKPEDQKEISVLRLRKWCDKLVCPATPGLRWLTNKQPCCLRYSDLLDEALKTTPPAIVGYQNIGDANPDLTCREMPYFDGDNWPDILEDIVKCVFLFLFFFFSGS
jgi:hypothetical protein